MISYECAFGTHYSCRGVDCDCVCHDEHDELDFQPPVD